MKDLDRQPAKLAILRALYESGDPMTTKATLAAAGACVEGSSGRLTDPLEQAGLIRKHRTSTHVMLSLTPEGQAECARRFGAQRSEPVQEEPACDEPEAVAEDEGVACVEQLLEVERDMAALRRRRKEIIAKLEAM